MIEYLSKEEYIMSGYPDNEDLDVIISYVNSQTFSLIHLTNEEFKKINRRAQQIVKEAIKRQVLYLSNVGFNNYTSGTSGKTVSIGKYSESHGRGNNSNNQGVKEYANGYLELLTTSGLYSSFGKLGF